MNDLVVLFESWITAEPVASLWLGVAAAILFGVSFARHGNGPGRRPWGQAFILALAQGIGFVALLGMFSFLLGSACKSFREVYGSFLVRGSLVNQSWRQWERQYGGEFTQRGLRVILSLPGAASTPVSGDDNTGQIDLSSDHAKTETALPSVIESFSGRVDIHSAVPVQRMDTYNAYTLSASYEYRVTNPMDKTMRAEFHFPLSESTQRYEDVSIKVNEKEIASYQVAGQALVWAQLLQPGEEARLSIHYAATGMDWFIYEIDEPGEVRDFDLTLTFDAPHYSVSAYPDNGSIQQEIRHEAGREMITWTIAHAILAPRLGFNITQLSYDPYHAMIVSFPYAQRGLLLCFSLVVLTFLVCQAGISLRQIALLAGVFVLPYLLLMSGMLPVPALVAADQFAVYQVHRLPLLSLFLFPLIFLVLRGQKRFPFLLSVILIVLFMAGYPLIGLEVDEKKRNVYEGMIQVAMLAYLFLLTLSMHVRKMRRPPMKGPA